MSGWAGAVLTGPVGIGYWVVDVVPEETGEAGGLDEEVGSGAPSLQPIAARSREQQTMDAPMEADTRRISFGLMTAPLVEPRRPDGTAHVQMAPPTTKPCSIASLMVRPPAQSPMKCTSGAAPAELLDGLLVGIVPGGDDHRVGDDEPRALGVLDGGSGGEDLGYAAAGQQAHAGRP